MYPCTTHVHMYTCIHVHMYTCTHVYMYPCTHVPMCTCTHVHMYTCTHVHSYALLSTRMYAIHAMCVNLHVFVKRLSVFYGDQWLLFPAFLATGSNTASTTNLGLFPHLIARTTKPTPFFSTWFSLVFSTRSKIIYRINLLGTAATKYSMYLQCKLRAKCGNFLKLRKNY
jgi:hypothetical protein